MILRRVAVVWRCAVRCSTDAATIAASDAKARCSTLKSALETVMGHETQREELLHKTSQTSFCLSRHDFKFEEATEQLLLGLSRDADVLQVGDCPSLTVALLRVS
jgi:hypothetical protein